MSFLYVQTWVISKGKTEEHDDCAKRILKNYEDKWKTFGLKSMPRYFGQRYGPMGARVFILEFESNDDFHNFWEKHGSDEKTVNLRDEWLK